jgi:hypothetical protein
MGESCRRRLDVERYSVGEITGPAAAALEEHLHTCQSCGAYCARVKKEREEFLRVHPFADLRATGATDNSGELWYERLSRAVSQPLLRPVLIPVCVLMLVAVAIVPFVMRPEKLPLPDDVRYKGAASLSYIYKRSGVVHESGPADLFRGGDLVQLFYSSKEDRNLSLFSVDTKGNVSFYQPDGRSAVCSIRSGAGSRLAYPTSIALDSASGAELVVALFSDDPFDTVQIKKWVEELKIKNGDMNALERAVNNNPPGAKSSVQTLILKKG